MKKEIQEYICCFPDIDGKEVSQIILELQDMEKEYTKYSKLKVNVDYNSGDYYSSHASYSFDVFGLRLENDDEYAYRRQNEKDEKIRKKNYDKIKEEEEKLQLKQLANKYKDLAKEILNGA